MKKTRINLLAAGLCAAGLLAGFTSVNQLQAQTYDITFNGAANGEAYAANGQIDVVGGLAINGSITVTAGNDLGTYSLLTSSPTVVVPVGITANLTGDNEVSPNLNPFLDGGGLVFTGSLFNDNQSDVGFNLWGNGPGSYSLFDASATQYTEADGTATITPAPEPATLALAGLGGLGVLLLRRRR
jgi:hypothetical protein